MATFSLVDEEPEDISCICGLVEPEVEGILLGYDDEDRKNIERELVEECSKQALLHARGKIFNLAKAKVIRCIKSKEAVKLFGDTTLEDTDGYTALLSSYVEKWELVARRVEHRISHDILEILTFVLGTDAHFPSKLIKEASLSKGSLSNPEDSDKDKALVQQLERDIECAQGVVTVDVVKDNGNSQVISVCVPTEKPISGETTAATPFTDKGEISTLAMRGNTEIAAETDAVMVPPACCKCNCHLIKSTPPVEESISASAETKRLVPITKDMASQTDDKPVTRLEFEYQSDYIERMCLENRKNTKEIIRWKGTAIDKIKELEAEHRREMEIVRKQQKRMMEDILNLRKTRAAATRCDKDNVSDETFTMRDEIIEVQAESQDISVWDFPLGQSTPPRKEGAASRPSGTRGPNTSQQPVSGTARAGKGTTVNRQSASSSTMSGTSYRVGIEIMEGSDSASSSSATEGDYPTSKKMRYDSTEPPRPGEGNSGSGRGRGRGRSIGARLRSISEETATRQARVGDSDEAWSDMDDGSPFEVLADEADGGSAAGTSRAERKQQEAVKMEKLRSNDGGNNNRAARGASSARPDSGESTKHDKNVADDITVIDSDSDQSSYAGVAAKDMEVWLTPGRKRKNTDTKHSSLKGKKSVCHREIYVQGLDCSGMKDHAEMEKLVQGYCKQNGVTVMFIKVIPVKLDKSLVGCKLSVLEEDFQRVIIDDFWPEFVTVRPWRYRTKAGQVPGDQGGNAQ